MKTRELAKEHGVRSDGLQMIKPRVRTVDQQRVQPGALEMVSPGDLLKVQHGVRPDAR